MPYNESEQKLVQLEKRLCQLEIELGQGRVSRKTPVLASHPGWPLVLLLAACVLAYLGVGLPHHYYQPLFAGLTTMLAYHRQWWCWADKPWRWPLATANFAALCFFYKFLIGGGKSYPLDWLKVPTIQSVENTDKAASWWDKLTPSLQLVWQDVATVTDWSIDITRIQTLFLIATLIGALLRFQPFASLTAFALLIVSLPTFFGFNWDWVVLFLVLGGTGIYLQTSMEPGPHNS